MYFLIILAVGALNITCFLIGVKTAQKVIKGEEVKLPELNPLKAYREAQDRKEAEREAERRAIIMQNIDNYDGTGANQKDVN
mgnify:CR=1 FL=1